MSFKSWLSVVTLLLIAVIIFISRHELMDAWNLLGTVNIWILLLIIPAQIFTYYVGGEMMFSYLRSKGSTKKIPPKDLIRMALEMNFVNHVLPSGGVSGISYMTWRLARYDITAGRAAMAQIVRFAMAFASYIVLLPLAVLIVTIDGSVNRWIIFISFSIALLAILFASVGIYLLSSRRRMWKFADLVVRYGNNAVKKISFGRKTGLFKYSQVEKFFSDVHFDYMALRHDRRILIKPFVWGIVFTICEVMLFVITFWSMGVVVNPAPILIAYGVALTAGLVAFTPGGTGAYEAVMVGFLLLAGLDQSEAIAGIVLTRVILLLGTIVLGYVFYQKSLLKYGNYANTDPSSK